jgi:phage-related protein
LISRYIAVIGAIFQFLGQIISTAIQMVLPVIDLLGTRIGNMAKIVMQIVTGDFKGAFDTFLKMWRDMGTGIGNIISTWGDLIGSYFGITWAQSMSGWQSFFNGIGALLSDMLNNFRLVFVGIPTLIGLALGSVTRSVGAWFAAQLVSWTNGWKSFQAAVAFVFEGIRLAIDAKFNEIVNGISLFISNIVTAFNQSAQQFADIGTTIVAGIQLGISGAWASLTTIVTGLVGDLISAIKKMFGLGGTSGAGVTGGITEALKGAVSGGTPATANATSAGTSGVAAQRTSGNGSGQNIGKVVNNFIGPITLKLQSDSDFLQAR